MAISRGNEKLDLLKEPPVNKSWVWVCETLQSGTSQGDRCDVNMVDNIIIHNGRPTSWAFTNKSGQVLKKGYYVQARWRGKRKYYSGWVHNVNADGTLDVQYDDGDFEHNVPVSLIKRVSTNVHPSIKAEEDKLKNGGDGGSSMGFLSKYLPESYYDSDATFLFIVLCLFSYIFLMKLFIVLKRALSCCF